MRRRHSIAVEPLAPPRDVRRVEPALLNCRECERKYRLRNGTAAAAWRSGQLPGRQRGRKIMVSATAANRLFGVGL